jgi:phenylacetyl-CoA:acceptor oxidoreductase subunit 2
LLVAAAVARTDSPWPAALAIALVGAGLFAVWMEIGRKLRALHVLFNPLTSWMTRESFAALLLFPLALGAMSVPAALPGAALAAAAFLYCQARILREAKGIPAWRDPAVVPLIVATGLAEGAGLCLLFTREPLLVGLFALAVFARELAARRHGAARHGWRGTLPILLLAAAGLYVEAALVLAGIAALASGWWLKYTLVTRAAAPQGFALPRIPVRGAR